MKKTLRKQVFDKMLDNANTLRILETKLRRGKLKKSGWYDFHEYQVVATIRDIYNTLKKAVAPFNVGKALEFVDGKVAKLIIDDSYRKFEVSI